MKPQPSICKWIVVVLSTVCPLVALLSGCASRTQPPGAVMSEGMDRAARADKSERTSGMKNEGLPLPNAAALAFPETELWVLARGSEPQAEFGNDRPGSGELLAKLNGVEIPMPLKHTDVQGRISGCIGTVEVAQQFLNPYAGRIEAIYVFALPHNAAVNEFVMTIGQRRIRGVIRERREAEQIYSEAKRQGYVASFLSEQRPNVFTQSVANLEPGKEIDVTIQYFHTLAFADGWHEFVLPMVVGPRYSPAGNSNGVSAVVHSEAGASGQTGEVHYLNSDERSGHDISLKVEIDAGVPIEEFECKTHQITHVSTTPEKLTVSLSPADTLPNRDFVLRYRVAGQETKSSLLTGYDERGGYFTLLLYPPLEFGKLTRQPLEVVFVLDCSGSMSGRPLNQAKAAVERGLCFLQPGDSFQLINFSETASQLVPAPLPATPENVRCALEYLRSFEGEAGTMMAAGVKAALDFPHDPKRLRFVCFLTDGYVGNESEVLSEICQRLGPARIFSFGIGSAVNRYLLDSMACLGRGVAAYLGPHDDAAQILEDFFNRISHPVLTDLAIDWGGLQVSEVFPRKLPDLFAGRSVMLTGRCAGTLSRGVCVSGTMAGALKRLEIPIRAGAPEGGDKGLANIWARMKIADLAQQAICEPTRELPRQMKQTALDYGLVSAFTAFIAVDSSGQTEGTEGLTAPVAAPVPEGVNYDTTVKRK